MRKIIKFIIKNDSIVYTARKILIENKSLNRHIIPLIN